MPVSSVDPESGKLVMDDDAILWPESTRTAPDNQAQPAATSCEFVWQAAAVLA